MMTMWCDGFVRKKRLRSSKEKFGCRRRKNDFGSIRVAVVERKGSQKM